MNKRISAAFIIMLFALGIAAIPVEAHFTLGDLTGAWPYRTNDYDTLTGTAHVTGVIGYVWPGGGYSTGSAATVGTTDKLWAPQYPGYMPPFPHWKPGGATGGSYPLGWYQADDNNYAPFGAIMTSTIASGTSPLKTWWGNPTIEGIGINDQSVRGDLLFGFNATKAFFHNYTEMWLFVPPEFTNIASNKVVASWTNNYDNIQVKQADVDRNVYGAMDGYIDNWGSMYAPGWTVVRVHADMGKYYNETQKTFLNSAIFYYPHCMNFTGKSEWYYLRLNDVIAPTIAGRYFFKVAFKEPNATKPATGSFGSQFLVDGSTVFSWMPIENWPVLTVKGEVDPAVMSGTIRYGGWNTTLYNLAVKLSGRVRVVGMADDPYTGKTTGRPVEARGYFNQTANGHYEVEGIAPGVYDVYASCAGYPEVKISGNVKILKGQSYHIDGYLLPGAVIKGDIYSKCGTGEIYWPLASDVKVELYAVAKTPIAAIGAVKSATRFSPVGTGGAKLTATTSTYLEPYPILPEVPVAPDPGMGMPVSWSPWGTYTNYPKGLTVSYIKFPWYEYLAAEGGTIPPVPTGAFGFDPWGVGPAQTWKTDTTKTSFHFQFGDRGKYGAPCDWTGHVPEINATWVNGLGGGQYVARAWIQGYVQTQADGVTFDIDHSLFTIAPVEWPGDITVQFDMRRSQLVKKIIHFHDVPGTLTELSTLPLSGFYVASKGIRYRVYVKDAAGYTWGYSSSVYATAGPASYTATGYSHGGYSGRSYGMPAGNYKIEDAVEGFVMDPKPQWVSLGLCGTTVEVSNHVWRGARFNITIFSKDWEHPTVDKAWKYDNEYVFVGIYDSSDALVGVTYTVTDWNVLAPTKPVMLNITDWDSDYWFVASTSKSYGFDTGLYSFRAFTYGYVQKKPVQVYCTRGALADIPIKLTIGAQFPVTVKFKHEAIFDDFHYNSSVRIRMFNDANKLVAEYLTSDPWHGYIDYTSAPIATSQTGAKGYNPLVNKYDDDLNYVPATTTTLQVQMCGLPNMYDAWYGYSPDPVSDYYYGWYDPTGAINTILTGAPYGIDAQPNYNGAWRLEVDVVPWYNKGSAYYAPPPGVLYGESEKYILQNHFGPWELRYQVIMPSNHLGGEASVYFELDLRGLMQGTVLGYTYCGEWRSTSWTTVKFTAADGKAYAYDTRDGVYEAWLPAGQYTMSVNFWSPAGPGYSPFSSSVYVTDGGLGSALNVYLNESGVPIPEFPVAAVVLAFSLAASLFILRRRRK